MKKFLWVAFFCLLFANTNTRASALSELFSYDETSVSLSLSDVAMLENYVNTHSGVTLSDLVANSSELSKNILLDINFLNNLSGGNNPVMGIPSFAWGCVLNWVGILIVYMITDGDKVETKKALIGCFVQGGVIVLFYVVVFALEFALFASGI